MPETLCEKSKNARDLERIITVGGKRHVLRSLPAWQPAQHQVPGVGAGQLQGDVCQTCKQTAQKNDRQHIRVEGTGVKSKLHEDAIACDPQGREHARVERGGEGELLRIVMELVHLYKTSNLHLASLTAANQVLETSAEVVATAITVQDIGHKKG